MIRRGTPKRRLQPAARQAIDHAIARSGRSGPQWPEAANIGRADAQEIVPDGRTDEDAAVPLLVVDGLIRTGRFFSNWKPGSREQLRQQLRSVGSRQKHGTGQLMRSELSTSFSWPAVFLANAAAGSVHLVKNRRAASLSCVSRSFPTQSDLRIRESGEGYVYVVAIRKEDQRKLVA